MDNRIGAPLRLFEAQTSQANDIMQAIELNYANADAAVGAVGSAIGCVRTTISRFHHVASSFLFLDSEPPKCKGLTRKRPIFARPYTPHFGGINGEVVYYIDKTTPEGSSMAAPIMRIEREVERLISACFMWDKRPIGCRCTIDDYLTRTTYLQVIGHRSFKLVPGFKELDAKETEEAMSFPF